MARFLGVFALACSFSIAACDSPPEGMDAGRDTPPPPDVPMELPDSPTVLSECLGMPTPCGTLANAECSTVLGCSLSVCRGFPVNCDRIGMETPCVAQLGCSWTGSTCIGTAAQCTPLLATECAVQMGCTPGPERCGGTAIDCELLPRSMCLSQPGCMEPPDAGVDAGPVDAPPLPCEPGSTEISLRVVGSAGEPLAGVAVRAQGESCGVGFEETTGADGRVTFMVDEALGPWSVTAAQAGRAAVSVLDVLSFPFEGDLRLDPATPEVFTPFSSSGTLSGSVGVGNNVQIDAADFETIIGAGATWASQHYVGPTPVPLQFVAVELDTMGDAVNFAASPSSARPSGVVSGVALALPTPAATAREHRLIVERPSAGILADAAPTALGSAHHVLDLPSEPFISVGSARWDLAAEVPTLVVRDFAPVPANWVIASLQGSYLVNVYLPGLTADATYTVGQLEELAWGFGFTFGDATATARGDGFGYAAMHLGEDASRASAWRVFATIPADGTVRNMAIPFLPSTVTLTDIGMPEGFASVLLIAIETDDGVTPWTLPNANSGVRGYRATAAGGYTGLETTGR